MTRAPRYAQGHAPALMRDRGTVPERCQRRGTLAPALGRQQAGRTAALLVALLLVSATTALQAADPVRIAGASYLGDAPTVVADQRGLFSAHDLSAQVSFAESGKRNLERLRAGEVDFALMALTPLVFDRLADATPRGPEDPVILASLVHTSDLHEVLVHAESEIARPRDLAGKKLGVTKRTSGEFAWQVFTLFNELDADTVELIDRPAAQLANDLAHGRIDAAVLWAPWRARLQMHAGFRARGLRGANFYAAKWVLVTRRDTSEAQRRRCRALLSAYRDAIGYIRSQPAAAMELYRRHAGLSADVLQGVWEPLSYDLNLDWTVISTLQQQFAWARRRDAISAARPDVTSLLAPQPLRALMPSAVGVPRAREEEGSS